MTGRVKRMMACFLGLMAVFFMAAFSSVAAAEEKPVELSLNIHLPARSWAAVEEWGPWAKKVEDRCNGRVKINIYFGATLSSPADAYESAVKGIADMAWGAHSDSPGRFPMVSVFNLPGLGQSMMSSQHVMYDLYQKYPEIDAEHKGVKVIWLAATRELSLQLSKKPVRQLEDMKGLRVRAPGFMADTFKAWGAAPIPMPTTDCYSALQRNVIDGTAFDWTIIMGFKIHEVTKYAAFAPFPSTSLFLVMNEKKWNSLPEDIQKAFLEEGKRHWLEFPRKSDGFAQGVINNFKGMPGHEVTSISAVERERWMKAAQPAIDKWVADMESKGLPGRAYFEEARSLAKKYDAQYPAPWLAQ